MFNKLFQDKDGKVAVWQKPNVPLWVWLLSTILARLTNGDAQTRFKLLAAIALITWALLEIFWGASYFRRLLGAAVLTVTIFMFLSK